MSLRTSLGGAVTATLASWMVEKVSLEVKVTIATEEQVEQLRADIAEMKEMIRNPRSLPTMPADADAVAQ